MEKKIYTCAICNKSYDSLESYMNCVNACGEKIKIEKLAEKERMKNMNLDLNKIKAAKEYYDGLLEKFKEDYPDEYKLNFRESECPHDCKGNVESETKARTKEVKPETIELYYEGDGKNKPKIVAKVNGEEVDDKAVDSLLHDPETKFIAQLLGLI